MPSIQSAIPMKDIRTAVQALSYGIKGAVDLDSDDKISKAELNKWEDVSGFGNDVPEQAIEALLSYAKYRGERLHGNADMPHTRMMKALGDAVRGIANRAGSAAGKGFRDGDVLSKAEFAELPKTWQAVALVAAEYPKMDGKEMFPSLQA